MVDVCAAAYHPVVGDGTAVCVCTGSTVIGEADEVDPEADERGVDPDADVDGDGVAGVE